MKRVIILVSLFFICSCAPQRTVKEEKALPPPPVSEVPTQTLDRPILLPGKEVTPLYGELLSKITTSASSFNPSHGEDVAVYFQLSNPAKVSVHVYDPDHGLIKRFQ